MPLFIFLFLVFPLKFCFSSLTAQQVLQQIEGSSSGLPPANSVEILLSRLPTSYRSYFILQYQSHSNHDASPLNPRVIFFGPDAKLLFAFSGLPSDPHYNTVEMIEYEKEEASFRFYSIHFKENGPAQIEIQPRQCQNCHGPDPKPNWEPYSLWPGAYGSLHDRILRGTRELENFKSFLATYQQSSRYRFLEGTFHLESQDIFGNSEYYLTNQMMGPGSALSVLLSALNQDRIATKLLRSHDHAEYRYAITAALLGCNEPIENFLRKKTRDNHPISFSETLTETRRLMKKDIARKLRLLSSGLGVSKNFVFRHADLHGLRPSELIRISKLRYLLKKRTANSIDFDWWALGISKTSLDFNDGIGGLQNLLGRYLPQAFEEKSAIRKSIQIKKIPFHFHSTDHSQNTSVDTFILESDPEFSCHLLLKEVRSMAE